MVDKKDGMFTMRLESAKKLKLEDIAGSQNLKVSDVVIQGIDSVISVYSRPLKSKYFIDEKSSQDASCRDTHNKIRLILQRLNSNSREELTILLESKLGE